mgnify:CR=1 FL=1
MTAKSKDIDGMVSGHVSGARAHETGWQSAWLARVAHAQSTARVTCGAKRHRDGTETEWTVLGSSRGEGGILGEGIRQALLRDRTYGPALAAATHMTT